MDTSAKTERNKQTGHCIMSASPATASAIDTRNLHWKSNNVGSKLLEKMGWKEGQGIGKRRRVEGATTEQFSTEGLRPKKRAEGLGLGASTVAAHTSLTHVVDFSDLLQELHKEHAPTSKKQKKKRKTHTTPPLTLPTNKSTHAKVREAKFREKSEDDMKCIFGASEMDFPVLAAKTDGNGRKKKKDKKRKMDT